MTRGRILAAAIIVLAALPFAALAGYRIATRWLLSGPKLRALINVKPESFEIDWDEATSLWPGRVHIRNLRIRGSDPNVQWQARLPTAELTYSVPALLTRTFRCTRLTGSGLSFVLRSKLDPDDAKNADISLLPPIPGFSDPPLRSPDDHFFVEGKPWHIDIRHITIDRAEELWFNTIRYRGLARVEGGFFLNPLRLARIDAAGLRFDGGALEIGKSGEGITLTGSVSVSSEPFAPLNAPGAKALAFFTAKLDLDVRLARLQALSKLLTVPGGVRIEGGEATVHLDAAFEKNAANGKAAVTVQGGILKATTYRLKGNATAEIPIRGWNPAAPPFDVSGTRVALTDVHSSGPSESRGWWGRFEIPSGKAGATASGRVEAHCRDARPLLNLLGVQLPGWTSGLLKLDDLAASAQVSLAPGRLAVRNLEATGGNFHIQGHFSHEGKDGSGAFLIESGILVLGVEVPPESQPAKVRPFFARQWYEGLEKAPASKAAGR